MASERDAHSATLLPDGKVLVTGGGQESQGYVASAELYDPATETWSPAGHLTIPRLGPTATLLPTGDVLVAGGFYFVPLASADLYDPTTGAWDERRLFRTLGAD